MREEQPLAPTSAIPIPKGWASSLEELLAAGRAQRHELPRSAHASTPATGRDPIALLEASNAGRLPELVPIRHGRMLASPFAFFRGAAGLMAHDLASQPHTGLMVQACGDAHLLNFGLFATPERNLVFDLNDFDETHAAPWEWDVKRLATAATCTPTGAKGRCRCGMPGWTPPSCCRRRPAPLNGDGDRS